MNIFYHFSFVYIYDIVRVQFRITLEVYDVFAVAIKELRSSSSNRKNVGAVSVGAFRRPMSLFLLYYLSLIYVNNISSLKLCKYPVTRMIINKI